MLSSQLPLFAFSLRDRLATMSWLEMVLWIGLAFLTVALLVLMGTRWGQVRPVSKCVVLSVFAHILFVAYAYGTKLSFGDIGWSLEPTVRVTLADGDDGEFDSLESDNAAFEPADVPPSLPVESAVVQEAPSEPVPAEPAPPPAPAPELARSAPELLPELHSTPSPAEITPAPPPPLLPNPEPLPPTNTNPPPLVESSSENSTVPEAVADTEPAKPEPVAETNPDSEVPRDAVTPEIVIVTPSSPEPPSMPVTEAGPAATDGEPTPTFATASASPPAGSRRPVDDQPLPEPYRMRGAENRLQLAIPFGATENSESAVEAALGWLASVQSADGRWDASSFGAGRETKTLGHDRQGAGETADMGITGLALLAFLGAGQTHVQGDYRETVQHGLEFLLRGQAADGNLAGPAKLFEKMYCHGIASLALGEAFALTGDPRLQSALRHAVTYSAASQHPVSGGWRYQPGDRGDMSQFGWQVMALRSAELGGIPLSDSTRNLMLKFLESATTGTRRGLAGYRAGERPTRTMTAEAMACRFFLQLPPGAAATREATDFVMQELPGRGQPNLYYWYYATLALYQDQGPSWTTWNEALQGYLIANQRRDGRLAGSWDTNDVWGGYGGRVYTTAMGALCLEVYYRYLPLYAQTDESRHAEAIRSADPVRR